jgi:hypothetical protein
MTAQKGLVSASRHIPNLRPTELDGKDSQDKNYQGWQNVEISAGNAGFNCT